MAAFPADSVLKARATEQLTLTEIHKLERQKYRALAFSLFLVAISFLWLLIPFAPQHDGPALFSNSMYALTSFVGAFWSLLAVYQALRGPVILSKRHVIAWALLGLGLFFNGLANILYGVNQFFLSAEPPLPSSADVGFIVFYICCMAGVLLLPAQTKIHRLGIHLAVDGLITMLCLLGVSWYFLINPVLINPQPGALLQALVGISYPCWDILLFMVLMLFVHQRTLPFLRPSIWICSLGVLAEIWADAGYAYLTNAHHYHSGMVAIDPFWFIGSLAIGIAPLYQYFAIARYTYINSSSTSKNIRKAADEMRNTLSFERRFVLLQSVMIYIPFIALLSITLYSQIRFNNGMTHFLDMLCAVVFCLLVIRYTLATYENARLIHEKEQSRNAEEVLRKSTASLSSVLEMDLLLSHIVILGASELGFEAASLVVLEEYDRPLAEQTSVLARATTSEAMNVMSWRLTGQRIPFCLAMMGKEMEMRWQREQNHPPTLVHQWHLDKNIQTSLFVPLAYQGKTQGCVAFSIRESRRFSKREYYLARAFAEEAANAIEHARLYGLARENAHFAQAMSNVAARLNSVVATGMGLSSEINNLICTEGANALHADLAILYSRHYDGQFVPLGAFACDPEPQTFPQEWPPIAAQDYNDLLLHSQQPALVQIEKVNIHDPHQAGAAPTIRQRRSAAMSALQYRLPDVRLMRPVSAPLRSKQTVLLAPSRPEQPLAMLKDALRRRYVSTAIMAPLIIRQAPMGLLVLARTHRSGGQERRAFAQPDLELSRDFAEQAAIAFTNVRLYQQIHRAHRRMQELDQLKDQFMVTASHELRTPLTAVQGYLELLENYRVTLSPEQQQEFLEKASRGCEELILLLNNVMDASRLEVEAGIRPAHLERVSVREVVESIIDLILLQATQERREIRVNIPDHLTVKADPTRLRQVIRNLSVNALKYSPPGTPLSFSAHPVFTQNAFVIINVTDYGKGIKPSDQAQLFQRFVRLESDLNSTVRGSGLGLYISRRLIEAMRGHIWVESSGTPGAGTTFSVKLPMA